MKNWMVDNVGNVVCRHCGAVIMTAEENERNAPSTSGTFSSSNAAENWTPSCPDNCPGSVSEEWNRMTGN